MCSSKIVQWLRMGPLLCPQILRTESGMLSGLSMGWVTEWMDFRPRHCQLNGFEIPQLGFL